MNELQLRDAGIKMDGRWLVRRISLELRPGRLTALVGPNGSGKSTVLKMLAGLWSPTEGEAACGTRPLQTFSRRALARCVSFVPQDSHPGFAFTVRDAVAMGRQPHLGRFEREREQDRKAIDNAMSRADVGHLADRLTTELSGGEQQRVLIARSLATESEVMLLDEPTASLDIAHALDVLELCVSLAAEGKSVGIAIHDLNAAAHYADRVALLSAGRIVALGLPAAVLTPGNVGSVFHVRADRARTRAGRSGFFFARSVAG